MARDKEHLSFEVVDHFGNIQPDANLISHLGWVYRFKNIVLRFSLQDICFSFLIPFLILLPVLLYYLLYWRVINKLRFLMRKYIACVLCHYLFIAALAVAFISQLVIYCFCMGNICYISIYLYLYVSPSIFYLSLSIFFHLYILNCLCMVNIWKMIC